MGYSELVRSNNVGQRHLHRDHIQCVGLDDVQILNVCHHASDAYQNPGMDTPSRMIQPQSSPRTITHLRFHKNSSTPPT